MVNVLPVQRILLQQSVLDSESVNDQQFDRAASHQSLAEGTRRVSSQVPNRTQPPVQSQTTCTETRVYFSFLVIDTGSVEEAKCTAIIKWLFIDKVNWMPREGNYSRTGPLSILLLAQILENKLHGIANYQVAKVHACEHSLTTSIWFKYRLYHLRP